MNIPLDSYSEFIRHIGDREYFGQKLGLERIAALLKRLGNPQNAFRSIHVAGTNGKGSTAAMLASIFEEAGYKTGLYTSPHLEDFAERIQVNGDEISHENVMKQARQVRDAEDEKDPLTFFELATAIGFLYFAEAKVDVAIVEAGLGGRLDATNVIDPMLSIITSIGLDHTAQLGQSLAEIAFEKSGVIKPAKPVVVGSIPPEAMEVLREQAAVKQSRFVPLFMETIPPNVRIGLQGAHQRRNANLAMAAVDVLNALGEVRVDREAAWRGLSIVTWPGRLETISEEPWIVLDGAHNRDAMREVREYVEEKLEGRRLIVLFGAMADKDIPGLLAELTPLASEFVLVKPDLKRAASTEVIREFLSDFDGEVVCRDTIGEALETERDRLSPDDVLLITGSFHLVGEVRRYLGAIS